MSSWQYKKISGNYLPRQFEYHPENNSILFGCLNGNIALINEDHSIRPLGHFGTDAADVILGLCWLKHTANRFVTGSGNGHITCGRAMCDGDDTPVVQEYAPFEKFTSIHLNCTDELLLLSGYTKHCVVLDLATGRNVRTYKGIHSNHINISRFMHTVPHVFATSSFDKSVKLWDMRDSDSRPVYTITNKAGVVMMSFAPNDMFLLTAGTDNEINQFFTLHGRKHMSFNVPKTGKDYNYTRAYYCNANLGNSNYSGNCILSGASEENKVRFLSSTTGDVLVESELYPGRLDDSLYVQSLRSHPHRTNEATALVNYRDCDQRELVHVKFAGSGIEDRVCSVFRDLQGTEAGAERVELLDMDNPLCTFPSRQLERDMSALREAARAHAADLAAGTEASKGAGGLAAITVATSAVAVAEMLDLPVAECSESPRRYPLHAFVLQARCPLLFERLRGQQEVSLAEVLLPMGAQVRRCVHLRSARRQSDANSIDAFDAAMSLVWDFLYTGTLEAQAQVGTGSDARPGAERAAQPVCRDIFTLGLVLWVACSCQLSALCGLVDQRLTGMLTVQSCFAVTELAVLLGRGGLICSCRHFLLAHWDWLRRGCPGALAAELADEVGRILQDHPDRYCSRVDSLAAATAQPHGPVLSAAFHPPISNGHSATVMGQHMVVVGGRDAHRCYSCHRLHAFALDTNCWTHIGVGEPDGRSLGPSNQFYHVAAPLRHTGGVASSAASSSGSSGVCSERYLLCLGGRIVPGCDAERGREVYILDCVKMRWLLPGGDLGAVDPDGGDGEIGADAFPPRSTASAPLPPHRSLMCHTIMPVHGKNTPSTLSKFLVHGGYRYESRSISHLMFLVVVTARLPESYDPEEGVSAALEAGAENAALQFEVSTHPVSYSVSAGAAASEVVPLPRMNHSSCRCVLYSGEGSGLEDFHNAYDTSVRMVIYGGVGYSDIFGEVHVARYEPSCSPDAASVTWEEIEGRGELPLPRYGHAMETLPHNGAMLMYGGRNDSDYEGTAFGDLWEMRYLHSLVGGRLVLQWTQVVLPERQLPPSVRLQMAAHGQDMLIFGGSSVDLHTVSNAPDDSDEAAAAADPVRHREVHRLRHDGAGWQLVRADPPERFSNGAPIALEHLSERCGGLSSELVLSPLTTDLLNCCRLDLPDGTAARWVGEASPDLSAFVRVVFEELEAEDGGRSSELDDSPQPVPPSLSMLAPRALLAVRSEMFRCMLSSNMTESTSGRISLRSPGAHCSLSLMVYILTDILAVRAEDVLDLLALADHYSFAGLLRQCEFILCRQCGADNALELLAYAEGYKMTTLRECCLTAVLMNWPAFESVLAGSAPAVQAQQGPDALSAAEDGGGGAAPEVSEELRTQVCALRSKPGHLFAAALQNRPLASNLAGVA